MMTLNSEEIRRVNRIVIMECDEIKKKKKNKNVEKKRKEAKNENKEQETLYNDVI